MEAASYDEIQRIPASHARAFRHLLFPRKLGAWIALLFAIGSTHFLVGALAANWPGAFPAMLRDGAVVAPGGRLDLVTQHDRQYLLSRRQLPGLYRGLTRDVFLRPAQRQLVDHHSQPGRFGCLPAFGTGKRGWPRGHLSSYAILVDLVDRRGCALFPGRGLPADSRAGGS